MAKAKKQKDQQPEKRRDSKMSKELRVAVDKIGEIAREPLAREILVAAAGAALAARKDARKAAKKAAREAGDAVGDSAIAAGWVGAAITAAAVEAGRRLLEAYDQSQGDGGEARSSARSDGRGPAKTAKLRKAKPAGRTSGATS
jgi:hypothetical protein